VTTTPATAGATALPVPTGFDVVWALGAGLGGMLLGALAAAVPALLLDGARYGALALVGAVAGGVLGLWLALVRRRGWGWRELGFVTPRRSAWHLLWEVPAALVVGLVCTATLGTLLGLAPDPASSTEPDVITQGLASSPWLLVVGGICVALVIPAVEEVIFRRVLLGWLLTKVPVVVAVLVASAVFAAVHLLPVAVLYVFFLAVSANLLYLWHRSLWAPLALHATNNALATLITLAALT